MKKKTPEKTNPVRKRSAKRTKEPHVYILPKTASELGIVCSKCGAPSIWFDYELGEKSHMQGFVCDDHRISNRVEKLARPQSA